MIRALAVAVLVGVSLSGCASQISALAPVSGDDVAGVRTAATDVLSAAGVELLVVPVCTEDTVAISCEGSAADGQKITVSAPLDGTMTVTLGASQLYAGSVQDVLDRAAQQ